MGHWFELSSLDTSEEQLLKVAQKNYGNDYAQELNKKMRCLSSVKEKTNFVKKKAA